MTSVNVVKFNSNFTNFLKDINEILGNDELKTIISMLGVADAIGDPKTKIEWFINLLDKEYDFLPQGEKITPRKLHGMEHYKMLVKILLDEAKTITSVNFPELEYDSLDPEDQGVIREYINSFVALSTKYSKELK